MHAVVHQFYNILTAFSPLFCRLMHLIEGWGLWKSRKSGHQVGGPHPLILSVGMTLHLLFGPCCTPVAPPHEGCQHLNHSECCAYPTLCNVYAGPILHNVSTCTVEFHWTLNSEPLNIFTTGDVCVQHTISSGTSPTSVTNCSTCFHPGGDTETYQNQQSQGQLLHYSCYPAELYTALRHWCFTACHYPANTFQCCIFCIISL